MRHFKHVFDETLDACRQGVLDIVQAFYEHMFYAQTFDRQVLDQQVLHGSSYEGGVGRHGEEAAMSAMAVGLALPARTGRVTRTSTPHAGGALRLTRRGRLVVVLVALMLAVVVASFASRAAADGPVSAVEVTRHAVAPGETLWALATGVAGPGEDVRDVVLEIQRLNRMSSGGLMAGEEILLPPQR